MNLQNLRRTSAFFLVLVAIGAKASPQLETMRKPVNGPLFTATLQGAECSPQDLLVGLTPRDAEYTDALELTPILRKHGFAVKCVLHSKRVALFEGPQGAVFFRTNRGNFDALFLPRAGTFNVLPNETRKNGTSIRSVEVRAQLAAPGIVREPHTSLSMRINCSSLSMRSLLQG